METPVPAERIAVFEINELPGRASIIDCAFFFGSSVGTLEACRVDVKCVVSAGRLRIGALGRSRVAPERSQ